MNFIEGLALLGKVVVFIEYLRVFYNEAVREKKNL